MFSPLSSIPFLYLWFCFLRLPLLRKKCSLKNHSSLIKIIFNVHKQNPFTKSQFLGGGGGGEAQNPTLTQKIAFQFIEFC